MENLIIIILHRARHTHTHTHISCTLTHVANTHTHARTLIFTCVTECADAWFGTAMPYNYPVSHKEWLQSSTWLPPFFSPEHPEECPARPAARSRARLCPYYVINPPRPPSPPLPPLPRPVLWLSRQLSHMKLAGGTVGRGGGGVFAVRFAVTRHDLRCRIRSGDRSGGEGGWRLWGGRGRLFMSRVAWFGLFEAKKTNLASKIIFTKSVVLEIF